MRIRKMLPVLCMALGLTMAAPLAAGATAEDVSGTPQTHRQPTKQAGTIMLTAPVPTPLTEKPLPVSSGLQTAREPSFFTTSIRRTVFCFSQKAPAASRSEMITITPSVRMATMPSLPHRAGSVQRAIPELIMYPVHPTTESFLPTASQKSVDSIMALTATDSVGPKKDAVVWEPRFTM